MGFIFAVLLAGPTGAPAAVEDNPAALAPSAGEVSVYARGDNARLHTRVWQTATSSWTDWIDLGGMPLQSGPGVDRRADGTTDVFALGAGNQMYHRYYTSGGGWTNWGALSGGCLTSAPAATQRTGTGSIDIFARGCDGQLMFNTHAGAWSGWVGLGGSILYSPAVISRPDGPINVFVIGSDHQLYQNLWTGSYWTGFIPLGGYLTSAPTVVSQSAGKYDIFARDSANNIAQRSWNGSSWSAWVSIPTSATSAPSAWSEGPNRVGIFVRGGSQMYINQYITSAWTGWSSFDAVAAPVQTLLGMATDTRPSVFNIFAHPYYGQLGDATKRVRLISDFDAALSSGNPGELTRVSDIVANARYTGAEVMLTLRVPTNFVNAPTASEYRAGVEALKSYLPSGSITYWGTLNEPNYVWGGTASSSEAERLADYYNELVGAVGVGRVVGPDFLDNTWSGSFPSVFTSDTIESDLANWVGSYVSEGGGFGVAAAFHPYGGISRRSFKSLYAYLGVLPSSTPVWLTEAGAVQRKGSPMTPINVDGHAVTDTDQDLQVQTLLQRMAGYRVGSRSVQRIYYYSYRPDPTWDSALIYDGAFSPKPSWYTFCAYTFSSACN